MKRLYYWIAFLLFFSCTSKENQMVSEKELLVDIQIESGIKNLVDQFLLSEVVQDIEIIPLETCEKSVFSRSWNISIGEEDLFVNTFENILRFDRKTGRYQNTIGKMGQGPTDIFYCKGCGLDERKRLVYTLSYPFGKNEVKSFTYDGVWQNTIKVARDGAWMEAGHFSGADRTYYYLNGKHVFRRMLPIQDGSKDLWQIGIADSAGKYLFKITDPACLDHQKVLTDHVIGKEPIDVGIVNNAIFSGSPIQNRYYNHINYLFSGNDTIYRYSEKQNVFKPRYILHCGKRPDFETIHKMSRDENYYSCLFVNNVLETRPYLYLCANRGIDSYLCRVDKENGTISSIRNQGVYKESSFWKVKYPEVDPPSFTNDLCGGLPFYPFDQDDRRWIAVYEASDLLEQIDVEELKSTEVLMPEKKEQLIRVLENLKEDDNPVVMVATLK